MNIQSDQLVRVLCLSQPGYEVVERFKMHEHKPIGTPLGYHMKLSNTQVIVQSKIGER